MMRKLLIGGTVLLSCSMCLVVVFFPSDIDPQGDETGKTRDYYSKAYQSGAESKGKSSPTSAFPPLSEKEQFYVDYARKAAAAADVPGRVARFVAQHGLEKKKVLEVGSGSGLLQDIVPDYTGLDISPHARRFFHKPFVEASATAMPFENSSFDAAWTIWVFEHIPNPEKAMLELRRVVKTGGVILFHPAFSVSRYAAQGYRQRPFGDFDLRGKLIKASAVLENKPFTLFYGPLIRAIRSMGSRVPAGPSRLHFKRLDANYDQFWTADSDATTQMSLHEAYLWFKSRGDKCLNCPSELRLVVGGVPLEYLTIQVQK